MGPSERRRAILEHLCQKRFDTTKNLAELFGVCERTIRNDLVVLTCSYPIETSFGPYGGIRVANWFHLNRHMLSFEQAELLRRHSDFRCDSCGVCTENREIVFMCSSCVQRKQYSYLHVNEKVCRRLKTMFVMNHLGSRTDAVA